MKTSIKYIPLIYRNLRSRGTVGGENETRITKFSVPAGINSVASGAWNIYDEKFRLIRPRADGVSYQNGIEQSAWLINKYIELLRKRRTRTVPKY